MPRAYFQRHKVVRASIFAPKRLPKASLESSSANPKPRRKVYYIGKERKVRYTLSGTNLRGMHSFINSEIVMKADLLPSEIRAACLRAAQKHSPLVPVSEYTNLEAVASGARRGPPIGKDPGARGRLVHRQLKTALAELKRAKSKRAKKKKNAPPLPLSALKKPWIQTILGALEAHGYTPVESELLVAWRAASLATEADLIALCQKTLRFVVVELKTTNSGVVSREEGIEVPNEYAESLVYAFRPEFAKFVGIRNCLLSQCHVDLWQVICTLIVFRYSSESWPTKRFPANCLMREAIVVHSPEPQHARVYRVPPWMNALIPAVTKVMSGHIKRN